MMKFYPIPQLVGYCGQSQPSAHHVMAPVSGKLLNLQQLSTPLLCHHILGCGVAIELTSYSVLAPNTGKISHISPLADSLLFQAKNGIKLQLNLLLSSECDIIATKATQVRPRFKTKADINQIKTSGQPLAEIKCDGLAKTDKLYCVVLLQNPSTSLSISYQHHTVLAGVDVLLNLQA